MNHVVKHKDEQRQGGGEESPEAYNPLPDFSSLTLMSSDDFPGIIDHPSRVIIYTHRFYGKINIQFYSLRVF